MVTGLFFGSVFLVGVAVGLCVMGLICGGK
jgi:hypothetical protein